MNEQWKKAVIHLECATDSIHKEERLRLHEQLTKKLMKSEISDEEYAQLSARGRVDIRSQGTALFVIHKNKRYLLTARHVLFDDYAANKSIEERTQNISHLPEETQREIIRQAEYHVAETIFPIVYMVPSLDHVTSRGEYGSYPFLTTLGAGVSWQRPYTFSNPERDLAIISLDKHHGRFADELIRLGYEPISSELISDGPSEEGAEIFTVGYPGATSRLGRIIHSYAESIWASSHYSLPVFSWGKVSMLHQSLEHYWCDISIYPGNSGGPVIENGKLVGIVSGQASISVENVPQASTRIPFGFIIKSNLIKELFTEQEAKDNN